MSLQTAAFNNTQYQNTNTIFPVVGPRFSQQTVGQMINAMAANDWMCSLTGSWLSKIARWFDH